ncbi:MAG: sn-glycerol-1-phosphate dehydrogenase, partial [Treponema sp.]|nr:sn-glycerol-1-phosphate dehydrogenase [Treponema sp.]
IQQPTISLDECIAISGGTKELLVGNDVYGKVPELIKKLYAPGPVYIVADANTMKVAGNTVVEIIQAAGIPIIDKFIFPGEPRLHAEYGHIETLVAELSKKQASCPQRMIPVAIGSGTINDLVKKASGEVALPYLCIPTAASVDGYTSYGAAILKDGFKQTLSCGAPLSIAADTNVMAKAPTYLTSSGFGDLAGKIIAGADWLISESVSGFGAKSADTVEQKAWAMVQHGLYYNIDRSLTAVQGDREALKALFEALSITGFAMQYLSDYRPVSGAEHLFAHVWEMDNLCMEDGNPVTHGHKVAMGSLACAAFLEILFADPNGPPPRPAAFRYPSLDERLKEVNRAFEKSAARESIVATAEEKFPEEKALARTNEGARDTWKSIRERVMDQVISYSEMKSIMMKSQCPVTPKEINLSRSAVIDCTRRAQMIRNRYNELDLASDLGCFQTVLAKMEASDKYLY